MGTAVRVRAWALGLGLLAGGCLAPLPPPPAPTQAAAPRRSLPPEMRPLEAVDPLTRAGLAVLLAREAPPCRRRPGTIVVDLRGHWARRAALEAVTCGWMEVGPGHRFDPDRPVTRAELARVLARVLGPGPRRRAVPPQAPADLSPDHLAYAAVRRVLAEGVMELDAAGRFGPARTVSAVEALQSIRRAVGAARP